MAAPNAATGTASSYSSVSASTAKAAGAAVAVISAVNTVSNDEATEQQKEYAVGSALITIGVACEGIVGVGTVAGIVLIAAGAALDLFAAIFGNKWHSSTQVRWMVSYYQRFVRGQDNVRSDNKVDEKYTQDAYTWWSAVTGVYIYDNVRYHALRGEDWKTGKPLNPFPSVYQRAQKFIAFNDLQNADRSLATVEKAVLICDRLDWKAATGAWQDMPVADFWYAQITPAVEASTSLDEELAALHSAPTGSFAWLENGLQGVEQKLAGQFATTVNNIKYALAGFAALLLLLFVSGGKKRKNSG